MDFRSIENAVFALHAELRIEPLEWHLDVF